MIEENSPESFGLGRKIVQLNKLVNVKATFRPPLNENFRQKLIDEYKEDIRDLSIFINKDLSHWIK